MRILCPGLEREKSAGGGSTFLNNLSKALPQFGHQCFAIGDYDVLLIAGASLCEREVLESAKRDGKPIVLRVDNILEDRKNKGKGMTKMREYADAADLIIYQSEWARKFLMPVIGKDGVVVHNGVDTSIFYPDKDAENKKIEDEHVFIYSKYSRGEGKHFEVVQQWWREHSLHRPQDTLLLVGTFADEYFQSAHPFEFHNGEKFLYLGVAKTQEQMADWFRLADCAVLPYFSDACSNTIIEAQACGLYVLYDHSGGTPEIVTQGEQLVMDINNNHESLVYRADRNKETFIFENFKMKNSLETMGTRYNAVINMLFTPEVEI